ncbi:hypothetical protein ACFC58_06490 [Kitasatospora purpeofusca]|uniref:hypothetical protein n=1 Tax=Kitasatospora purpeofusca TaxID=67352 RepID=UPI0035D7D073
MSSAAQPRVGRSYTRARRHPWVLGRLGDFRLPLGPYTPPQLIIASVGAFVLIKTVTWWAPTLGPFPVVVWAVAIWAARHSRVGGRAFGPAVLDAASLAIAPRAGRIAGRPVRPVPGHWLRGGFGIEEAEDEGEEVRALRPDGLSAPALQAPAPVPAPAAARQPRPAPPQNSKTRPGRVRPTRSRPAAASPAPPAPTRRRGPKAPPAPTPARGPAPTALELLLARAASDSDTTNARGTSR